MYRFSYEKLENHMFLARFTRPHFYTMLIQVVVKHVPFHAQAPNLILQPTHQADCKYCLTSSTLLWIPSKFHKFFLAYVWHWCTRLYSEHSQAEINNYGVEFDRELLAHTISNWESHSSCPPIVISTSDILFEMQIEHSLSPQLIGHTCPILTLLIV